MATVSHNASALQTKCEALAARKADCQRFLFEHRESLEALEARRERINERRRMLAISVAVSRARVSGVFK